jgi:hypothetical protein
VKKKRNLEDTLNKIKIIVPVMIVASLLSVETLVSLYRSSESEKKQSPETIKSNQYKPNHQSHTLQLKPQLTYDLPLIALDNKGTKHILSTQTKIVYTGLSPNINLIESYNEDGKKTHQTLYVPYPRDENGYLLK